MRFLLSGLTVLALVQPLSAVECAPTRLLRIVTRVEGQGVETGTFAALPKTVFRLGSKYARVEEAPDTRNNIHQLIVVNEPDSWIVNVADRSGQHVVDEGPPKVHLPLFAPTAFDNAIPEPLAKIEIGCAPLVQSAGGTAKVAPRVIQAPRKGFLVLSS
jgi:hypothetical protein